jgi:hypothetical protein
VIRITLVERDSLRLIWQESAARNSLPASIISEIHFIALAIQSQEGNYRQRFY